jgi:hypothetical protein
VLQPTGPDRGGLSERSGNAPVASSRLRLFALCLPAVLGLALWRVSLLHVNVSHLGDYGLPPALPSTWYIALLISVVGAVTTIATGRTNGLIAVGYIAVITVILFGTVPVLSAQPHYAWVYKHIGVVRYLEAHGKANPKIDIYNRWPGFFSLGAVFSIVGGSPNPEVYASWAEVFFSFLDAILVMAAVKAITRDLRIATGAGLLFITTNWVGQDYYSPQAFAFVLCFALIVIMLRQLRVQDGYSARLTRLIERVVRRAQLPPEQDSTRKWPRWAAISSVLCIDAVIVGSHQLTPYMLLVSLTLLMLAGVIRPWWVLLAMAIMTFAYLAANFNFIRTHYGVFTSIDPFNNARDSELTETPSAGKLFNTHTELLLIAALYLATICALVRLSRLRLLIRALPFVVLAVSPFFVLFGQNYGGEASLRIILFSGPWCAALISWGLATVVRQSFRWALMAFVALLFTALFVPSFLGQEEFNIISPAEVRASEWFYYHATPGSVLVLSAPGFPYRYGATYPYFAGPEGDANPNLLTGKLFQAHQLGAADVPRVADRILEYSRHGYVTFTKDESAYAEALGVTPPGALAHLEAAIAKSPHFRLWYTNSDVQIYELIRAHRTPSAPASVRRGHRHAARVRHGTARRRRRHHPAAARHSHRLPNLYLVTPESPVGKYVLAWRSPHVRIHNLAAHHGSRAPIHG